MIGVAAIAGVLLAFVGAVWFYRARELPVAGRGVFALLRGGAVSLVVLVLWNPSLPTGGRDVGPAVMVVDASGSMRASLENGITASDAAGIVTEDFDGVIRETPGGLADAAARAVEGGAESVSVVTDLRSGDGVALRALAAESSVPITVLDVGEGARNAGISGLVVPDRVRVGTEATIDVRLHATDREPRELALLVAGDTVARRSVLPGDVGTEVSVEFVIDVPDGEQERIPIEAAILGRDALAADDQRLGVLSLDDPGGGIVAVSWSPDWEFRTLIPLLDEVSGLRARGYLALGDGRWLRASDAPAVVELAAVRAALSRAEMVVVHAAPPADSGLVALARRVPRRLELSVTEQDAALGPRQPGEWYVASDIPVSPIAAELSGLELLGLAPLSSIRTGDSGSGSPILLQRAGAGTPVSAFDLQADRGERVVIAHAEGFWRWSLRSGDANELYRRLWSGLAAWLLLPDAVTRTAGFGPRVADAVPGESIEVLTGDDESVELVWTRGSDTLRVDTVAAGAGPLVTVSGFEQPGVVEWAAAVPGADSSEAGRSASGALVVQEGGEEMRAARDVSLVDDVAALSSSRRAGAGAGVPLRDTPWAWMSIVLLLSAEWIGRRRSGLR